jgi:hypothetical protein
LPEEGASADECVAKIAIETGRNLLFLSPFIRPASIAPAEWTFAAAWEAFLHLKEVSKIQRNLLDFADPSVVAQQLRAETAVPQILQFLVSAICRGSVVDRPWQYDARYFCVLDGVAQTVGQYVARCAATVIEANRRLDLFRQSLWINTVRAHRDNPSVLGFLVEKAVLGFLSTSEVLSHLLQQPDLRSQRVEVRTFKRGTESASLDSSAPVTLYIPEEFNYKAVDCVLRIIERRKVKAIAQPSRKSERRSAPAPAAAASRKQPKHAAAASASSAPDDDDSDESSADGNMASDDASSNAAACPAAAVAAAAVAVPSTASEPSTVVTLLPVQVTIVESISAAKRARSLRFWEQRAAWLTDFQGDPSAQIRFRFALVVRQCAMQADEPSVAIGHNGAESFQLSFFPLAAVNEQLDRAVDSPATAAATQRTSPPKLKLAP